MRRLSNNELIHMTVEGQKLLDENIEYTLAKCDYDLRKVEHKLNKDEKEPVKLDRAIVDNAEIIKSLNSQYAIKVKSISELNEILEKMGLIEKIYKKWYQTEKGKEYSIFDIRMTPPNIWTNDIIPLIADYLKENGYIPVSSSC